MKWKKGYNSPVETYPDHTNAIGTLQETSLHADLKRWYAQDGDHLETRVGGYVVDIVRGDLLVEIQTRNFNALKRKLSTLTEAHPVRLVHPIAQEKWIVRLDADGETQLSRRKSPHRGRLEHLFGELVRIPQLITHPNFTLEVLLIQVEEHQREDGKGSWRRKGRSIADRLLIAVLSRSLFTCPADFVTLLPVDLPQPFTTRDLSRSLHQPRHVAQKMVYCLSRMDAIAEVGMQGRYKSYLTVL